MPKARKRRRCGIQTGGKAFFTDRLKNLAGWYLAPANGSSAFDMARCAPNAVVPPVAVAAAVVAADTGFVCQKCTPQPTPDSSTWQREARFVCGPRLAQTDADLVSARPARSWTHARELADAVQLPQPCHGSVHADAAHALPRERGLAPPPTQRIDETRTARSTAAGQSHETQQPQN